MLVRGCQPVARVVNTNLGCQELWLQDQERGGLASSLLHAEGRYASVPARCYQDVRRALLDERVSEADLEGVGAAGGKLLAVGDSEDEAARVLGPLYIILHKDALDRSR